MTPRMAALAAGLSAMLALLLHAAPAPAVSTSLLISEVYGGGGNSGAPYDHDFIELINVSSAPVALDGFSLQYASASGSTWQVTPLPNVTLQPGRYFLVQEASGGTNGAPLPTPDATGTIGLAAASGKVALVASTTPLADLCPTGVIDLVGYGSANCSETAPTAALSNALSAQRKARGRQDTDDNSADFDVAEPTPQNTSSPTAVRLVAFTAKRLAGAVVFRWRTAFEAGVLGFNVYREGSRARVKLNRMLVPAKGAGRYAYRASIRPRANRFRLEAVHVDGTRSWLRLAIP